MKIDLNKTISLAILIAGYILFFTNINNHPPIAFIAIMGMFLIWVLWNKIAGSFIINHLIHLIALSGLAVSIALLVFYGIEPIGTRNGTLIRFHSIYIAFSIAVFLFSLLPYVILNMKIQLPFEKLDIQLKPKFSKKDAHKTKTKYILDDKNWEIIPENEALSGSYYID